MLAFRWSSATRASSCLQVSLPELQRCKSTTTPDQDEAQQPATPAKKMRSPDAWKARVPPGMFKHGSKLRAENPAAFERMRLLLGFYDLPHNRLRKHSKAVDKVYINNLQTLRYIGFDPAFKLEMMRYKTSTLNRELEPVLADTQALIGRLKASQGTSDFVPSIPGMTTAEGQGKQ